MPSSDLQLCAEAISTYVVGERGSKESPCRFPVRQVQVHYQHRWGFSGPIHRPATADSSSFAATGRGWFNPCNSSTAITFWTLCRYKSTPRGWCRLMYMYSDMYLNLSITGQNAHLDTVFGSKQKLTCRNLQNPSVVWAETFMFWCLESLSMGIISTVTHNLEYTCSVKVKTFSTPTLKIRQYSDQIK